MPQKSHYINLRKKYLPEKIKLIFLLESPPVSGDYFYDPDGKTTEQLFSSMMKIINCQPSSKADGLAKFAGQHYVLADATYSPVNQIKNKRKRNEAILRDLPELIDDLREIIGRRRVKIILVKANICQMLEEPLKAIGFNVVNNGIMVPFPGSGQQKNFFRAIKRILLDENFEELDKRLKVVEKKLNIKPKSK
jgi:hypothetical protein